MKTPKWPLVAFLSLATVLMVACGEDKDPRISDADVMCLKMARMGGGGAACGQNGSTGSNTTATVSTTVTNSTTVTVTQSNTSN